MTTTPRRILISGATGGIGGALALAYAAPGTTLHLQGRQADRLRSLADACRARGARVQPVELDVRDLEALRAWVGGLAEREGLDLVIASAGLNTHLGPDRQGERWDDVRALVEVNILAALATADAALPAMRRRGAGQIALFGSLAGWRGLPITPSYSASKAAIRVYGEALRDAVRPDGVRVNVILPGYVESKMCYEMPGPKPFLWTAERAAQRIVAGLAADRPRISFPFPLNAGCWALGVLPPALSSAILRWLHYSV